MSLQVKASGPEVKKCVTSVGIKGQQKNIFVVDEHPIVREGIIQIISTEPGWSVCGWANNADQAMASLAKMFVPDVAVVDISWKGTLSFELIKWIKSKYSRLSVIVLSSYDETLYAKRVFQAGGRGYVMKNAEPTQILTAIRTVFQGQQYFSPDIQSKLSDQAHPENLEKQNGDITRLTNRELEVFRLIGLGTKTSAITQQLGISIKTVETFRGNIKKKLGLKSGAELVRHTIDWSREQWR